jgi:hypothetical protein
MSNEFGREDEISTKKPKTKGFKTTASRLRRGTENHLAHRSSLEWRQDAARVCLPAASGEKEDIATINGLKDTISKSRTGEALLRQCEGRIKIVYDMQTPLSQFYPREEGGVIAMNPYHPRGVLLSTLTRELRRAWQHSQGALVNPLDYEPDEAILINRAQQADAFMLSIKVAWELKLQGEQEAWNHIAGSPLSDVTRLFEGSAKKDFRTLNNGEVARMTYDKFFEDRRTKSHDKQIIHQMLLDDGGYMKSAQKQRKMSLELFAKLGEMPHGKNYLSLRGQRSPIDTCYATVEDRSNANFLWFIKFERNFQEKEIQMIQESVKASAEIVDFAKWALHQRRAPQPVTH